MFEKLFEFISLEDYQREYEGASDKDMRRYSGLDTYTAGTSPTADEFDNWAFMYN